MTSRDNLNPGDKLLYIGGGFYGFDEKDRKMQFVKSNPKSLFTIWVKYQGNNLLVRTDDVELTKK